MYKNYNRRHFIKSTALLATGLSTVPYLLKAGNSTRMAGNPIRLGGPVSGSFTEPAEWAKAVKSLGYSAAYCPVQPGAPGDLVKSFREEAKKSNILIAEVGAWSNMLDPDESAREKAIEQNINALELADAIGAACCVNISGARGEIWDGPYAGNYSRETFDLIVDTVRHIIDRVKPISSFYSLEPMPYMLPDSPDSCLEIIKAVNRKQFAVHLDPVNMISSPQKYFNNAAFLKECFTKLGPYIKSIHAKDIIILPELTVHLEERRPGLGSLDYTVFLQEASKLSDIPFMLEHLDTQEDYRLAAEYVRETGRRAGISFG
jgi:sugar phosphate isomerase/epimerase